jgi:hypothetical protein
MLMFKGLLALGMSAACAAMASGSVVYEPVQFQYGPTQPKGNGSAEYFYYGGSHPRAVAQAVRTHYDYLQDGPNRQPRDFIERVTPVPLVYSDGVPGINLSIYGYTATDAQNEANATVPRYFRKADLLRAAQRQGHGHFVVPAQARPVPAGPRSSVTRPTTRPSTQPILIIPKGLLKKDPPTQQRVAVAAS